MWFIEGVVAAFQSIWANKLRSILTLIGVIIGVTTVVAVVSVISGMNNYVASRINSMGSNTFIIDKAGVITSHEDWLKIRKRKNLTVDDMSAIAKYCALCADVGGSVETNQRVKFRADYLEDVTVAGATHNFVDLSDVELDYGRLLTEEDDNYRRSVCIVGPDVIENLIKHGSPLGKDLKVGNYYFRIVGVAKKRGSFLGINQDNWVVVPLSASEKYFGRRRSISIYAKALSVNLMEEAQDEARMILRSRRKVKYNEEDDFSIMTAASLMQLYSNFTGAAWLVLIIISSISLLVGGIVIMNIMLVSVTERTREIGIRKAVGARRRDILWQFLVEALTLSASGGCVGILIGVGLAFLVRKLSPLPADIEVWAVMGGLGVAFCVGVVFGLAPAMKAARMDPIEALRYE